MSNIQKEILIVRSSLQKTLFDVVEVDYFEETIDYLAKHLEFEDAADMLKNLQPLVNPLAEEIEV